MKALFAGSSAERKNALRSVGVFLAVTFASAFLSLFLVDNFSVLSRVDQFVQDWEIASVFAPREAQDPDYCHRGRGRADLDALPIPFAGRQAISVEH